MKPEQFIRRNVRRTARFLAAAVLICLTWFCLTTDSGRELTLAVAPAAAAAGADKKLAALEEKQSKLVQQMTKMLDDLDASDEDEFSEEDEEQYAALEADLKKVRTQIERRQALGSSAGGGTQKKRRDFTQANEPDDEHEPDFSGVTQTTPAWEDDPKCGYKSHSEFLLSAMQAPVEGEIKDDRLKFLATAGSDEQGAYSDPYGGFFVPEGFLPGVQSVGFDGDPTMPTMIPMMTQVININARVDKNHTSSVSGGLTVGRTAETQQPTSSRQEYEQIKLEARMQTGLAYATEQLLERSPVSFAALLASGFRDEFASQQLKEKIYGTGAGEPQGVINSPGTVSVAKEGGQSADTIVTANILNMRKRAWRYSRSIWLANHDTLDTLMQLHIAGTNGDRFLYAPGNGTDSPDTFLGRPIYFTEWAKTIGDQGDLILGDWSQYLWGTLGSPMPRRAESVHVRFLNHERTFKFWVENDGQCWWRSALTPANGANMLSPFVVLDERA